MHALANKYISETAEPLTSACCVVKPSHLCAIKHVNIYTSKSLVPRLLLNRHFNVVCFLQEIKRRRKVILSYLSMQVMKINVLDNGLTDVTALGSMYHVSPRVHLRRKCTCTGSTS